MSRRSCLLSVFFLAVALLVVSSVCVAAPAALRLDCGTVDSPVMKGYTRLTGDDAYDPTRGYGWEGAALEGTVYGRPTSIAGRAGTWEAQFVDENADDLNRDGVVSTEDLAFRADVPNGTYRVTLTIGDLSQAIGSMTVSMNGNLVEDRVTAWAPGYYRALQKTPIGWWTYVRHTVNVTDGIIRVAMTKDQSYYDQQMAEQSTWENPTSIYWVKAWNKKDPPYFFIGFPFVHYSVMAIDILPYMAPPVVGDNDKLQLSGGIQNSGLQEAVADFNQGEFGASLRALKDVTEPDAQVAKAIIQLWLAGRPELEQEEQLVPPALEVLRGYVTSHPKENGVAEILQDAETFYKGLTTHLNRGRIRFVDGKAVQRNHFIENDKAIAYLWLIKEGTPLYYKSQLYIGQAGHMLMPYVPALGVPKQVFEQLEKKFPNNRFVRYYLHWEWEPYGDGTHRRDWYMNDYYSKTEGSPEWARLLQEAYAQTIDWSEYWVKFKQYPEGNIGGGFGDDVEIVGAFGYLGYLSKGVSDVSIQGTRNLTEAMWNLSEVDPDIGYCLPMADAEHTAEWTGNTLGMMVQIDHGNPLWIERSLKTARLMRDLWTDSDDQGLRHFRANFFGAAQVGGGDQANDSWINYRAIRPAAAVLDYNQNPAVSKWFAELGDAWVAAAMSTDRGKPRGVIPAQVSFPQGILGGTNSPNWHTASHPQGTVNYDWSGGDGQSYKGYIQDLLMTAYRQTGDLKYLEPIRLEYELTARYGYAPELQGRERLGAAPWLGPMNDTRSGIAVLLKRWTPPHSEAEKLETPQPAAKPQQGAPAEQPRLEEGTEQWVAKELKDTQAWLVAKRTLEGRKEGLVNDITKQQIIDHLLFEREMRKMDWPLMTTQASATDRIPVPGLLAVLFTYTGGGFGGPLLRVPITYVNTAKYFAAAVMAVDSQGFRILYHSMAPDAREIGIVPWELEPNGRYQLKYGPDADEDEAMDEVLETREFVFPQAGTPIFITVQPKVTYVVEVSQLERGRVAPLAPDPAISAGDIRFDEGTNLILAKVHNVGSQPVHKLQVAFYDGDPKAGGVPLGTSLIPNIEAPNDLDPKAVSVAVHWTPTPEAHEIYVVLDPNAEIKNEITTFNNVAHATMAAKKEPAPAPQEPAAPAFKTGRG